MKKLIAAMMTAAAVAGMTPVHAANISGRVIPGTKLTFKYGDGSSFSQKLKGSGYAISGKVKSIRASKKGYMPLTRKVTATGDSFTRMNFILVKKGKGYGELKGKVPQAKEGEGLILKQKGKVVRTYTISGKKIYDIGRLKPGYYYLYQEGNPISLGMVGITGGKTVVKNLDKSMSWRIKKTKKTKKKTSAVKTAGNDIIATDKTATNTAF